MNAELDEDPLHVIRDGLATDDELLGDRGWSLALGEQLENLVLAWREAIVAGMRSARGKRPRGDRRRGCDRGRSRERA
jgi:hypothetical protein